jgi:hypothetical protein
LSDLIWSGAQLELLDLAGRGLGQFAEHHALGRLEARDARARKGDEVGLGRACAGLEFNKGAVE